MKVEQLMSQGVIKIHPQESVAVASRTLTHYNIGALPVCDDGGKLCGMLTDRDVVTRCVAANLSPENTKVSNIMTRNVVSAKQDMDVSVAAHLMGRQQVRRLPVTENGYIKGMISLGDLARKEDSIMDAADALSDISSHISDR